MPSKAFMPDQPHLEALDPVWRGKIRWSLRQIAQHYAEPVNLSRLAQELSLGCRQFERLFKKAAGCSPSQYLMEQRIQRALQLIKRTDVKIESIIEMAGFHNRGHFFRAFTKRTGLSPETFRKSLLDSIRHSRQLA
jgi:AraC family transcriptional regulator, L-rhamnose operon transcriptional activator RhaR